METLNQLEEKVMQAVRKMESLKEENKRVVTALEKARAVVESLEKEKARLSAELQRVQALREENETLKKDREVFKERVERIIAKVEVLSDIVVDDDVADGVPEDTDGPAKDSSPDEESAVDDMTLYGGNDSG
jgi:FtsZ-binding cell division protein ZapB